MIAAAHESHTPRKFDRGGPLVAARLCKISCFFHGRRAPLHQLRHLPSGVVCHQRQHERIIVVFFHVATMATRPDGTSWAPDHRD